jgi:hypothetical protein
VDTGEVETAQLLYTEKEWNEMKRLKGVAGKE